MAGIGVAACQRRLAAARAVYRAFHAVHSAGTYWGRCAQTVHAVYRQFGAEEFLPDWASPPTVRELRELLRGHDMDIAAATRAELLPLGWLETTTAQHGAHRPLDLGVVRVGKETALAISNGFGFLTSGPRGVIRVETACPQWRPPAGFVREPFDAA